MAIVNRDAYRCDTCSHEWLKRKGEGMPTHCASSKCRSRRWNETGKGSTEVVETKLVEFLERTFIEGTSTRAKPPVGLLGYMEAPAEREVVYEEN